MRRRRKRRRRRKMRRRRGKRRRRRRRRKRRRRIEMKITPLILNLDTRWRLTVNFTIRSLYSLGK
jgi:hypothetical protein